MRALNKTPPKIPVPKIKNSALKFGLPIKNFLEATQRKRSDFSDSSRDGKHKVIYTIKENCSDYDSDESFIEFHEDQIED